jgi:hypothetical protein
MSILIEVFKDIAGMFLADVFLTVGTLVLVALVAGLIHAGLDGTWAGLILTAGALAVVIAAVRRKARNG